MLPMRYLQNSLLAGIVVSAACLFTTNASAQLSSNPDKFLGNITTRYQVDYGNEPFHTLWNQITPENESKWGSIEGNARGQFNWGCDNSYNYAKQHNFPFKFHCLIWGAQYPNWLNNLSPEQQYEAIVEWMDAVKERYPDLPLIDVVNEAVAGHQPAPYKEALGGDGKTGYDWIIKAFELAHERWPDAILIYNDYNTFQWQRAQFIDLVRTMRDYGAPVDAYGCQSHDLTDMNLNDFKNAMTIANQKHDVVALQVYDRRLEELPAVGLMKVKDAETGIEQWIDTSSKAVRKAHHDWWIAQKTALDDIFQKSNVDSVSIRTDQDYVKSLMSLFAQRN